MTSMTRVWDLPTRIFHWSLASLFVFMILSAEVFDNMIEWHMRAGYCVIALLVFRILWGFFGSHFSRFKQFVKNPIVASRYALGIFSGKATHELGHNPAGAWMVVVLILGLLLQALSGLFISDDIFWEAPFYGVLSDDLTSLAGQIHDTLQSVLIWLVGIHVAAVLWHRFRYRDPLIGAMIHGKKPNELNENIGSDSFPLVAFFVALVISVAIVVWLWRIPI